MKKKKEGDGQKKGQREKKQNARFIKWREINCNQIAEFSELMKCTHLKI